VSPEREEAGPAAGVATALGRAQAEALLRVDRFRDTLARVRELGGRDEHVARLVRAWLAPAPLESALRTKRGLAPAPLLAASAELEARLAGLVRACVAHPSADGSERLLVELEDGQQVESVLLARGALCISSQVGCAVGCLFCETGRYGLVRQLTAGEMLAQVVEGRRRRAVRRVVFMGMGEPSHNLREVLETLRWLAREGAFARENLVYSTVGERAAFEALGASDARPQLALSLHTLDAAKRAELLPRAPRIDPLELIELADAYAKGARLPWQLQWALLAGHNDGVAEFDRLADLLQGRLVIVNLIPFNPVAGAPFERPQIEQAVELVRRLKARGVRATLRRSGGPDVEAACGQLRARAAAERRR
jgi:23S rRNA (adenine2503-C2)-methyltransferase